MRSLKKTRRIQIIVLAFVSLAIATGLIGYAMRDGINFFRSPSQVIAEPPSPSEVFRIGGLVAEGSIVRGQGEQVQFSVTDGGAQSPSPSQVSCLICLRKIRAWSAQEAM
jgi:cytochrome c-type biogenesis protein CcmE